MKKQTKRTNNQKNAKHSKSGLIAFVANNFKYILATIAIIIAIIAVFFGESKLIFSDTKSANVNFNILYYRNVQTEERFLTLADAVANAETLQNSGVYATNTIQVINGGTETTAVTIPAGKNIVLDLNGKTITLNGVGITNAGNLTITDNTITELNPNATGKITATNGTAITSTGTLTIGTDDVDTNDEKLVSTTAPEISGTTYGINTTGTFNFYDGAITGPTDQSVNAEPNNTPTGYSKKVTDNGDNTETATLTNLYTVSYDTMNLLYGLNDCGETNAFAAANSTNTRIKYSISNKTVTVTATYTGGDAYGMTSGRVYLEAGRTYIFNCTTPYTWGGSTSEDTVEAFLMLNGLSGTNGVNGVRYYHMGSPNNYTFTPDTTGIYWLRLDVNQANNTNPHTFSDISITYADEENKEYGTAYGTLPSPQIEGYTFNGWNGKNLLNYNNLSTQAIANGLSVDNDGYLTDDTPDNDNRAWSYEYSNWFTNLDAGTYTLTIEFDRQATSQYAQYSVIGISGANGFLNNISKVTKTFTLDQNTDIGILVKVFDGKCRIQLEEGSESTAWEPYYVTSSTLITQTKDHTLTAKYTPNQYTVSFDENINYFNQMENTLTGFTGASNYYKKIGEIDISNISLNDTVTFEADVSYENLTANTENNYFIIFQNYGYSTMWSEAYYNSSFYKFLGTGTAKVKWSWTFDNSRFNENDFYACLLRTDYYTGGTITLSNIKVTKQNSTKQVTYGEAYGTLPTLTRTGYTFDGWYTDPVGGTQITSSTPTPATDTTYYAHWTKKYTIKYNAGNLLYGLNDCGETLGPNGAFSAPSYFMKYSISDKVVTATALQNDGYGMTSGRVDLEANREYVFSCTTNGTLGHSDSEDTIEIYLCKDGLIDTYYRMDTNNNFKFTPTVSGTYWLRLDVNQNGKTHTFSNITVTYADEANKEYGTAYGTLPSPSVEGYTFNGWYANAVKATTLIDNYEVSGQSIGYNTSYIVSEMIPIEGGTTLYSNIPICGIYTYDINKTRIKRESTRVTTHPISSNAKYIRIEICKTDDNQTLSYYQDNLVISDYQHLADITYKNDQITSSTTNTIPSDHTLFAKWTDAKYGEYNSSGVWQKGYTTLSDAFTGVTNGNTIKPLTDTTEPAVTQAKGTTAAPVTLDLNGHTITMTGAITNSGTLTVNGSGTISNTGSEQTIYNTGSLNVSGTVTITASGNDTIYNDSASGVITLSGGEVKNTGAHITVYNYAAGTVTINSGAKLSSVSERCIVNRVGGTIQINGGEITSSGSLGIVNLHKDGILTIIGGTISTTGPKSGYSNPDAVSGSAGTVNIGGGTITSAYAAGLAMSNATVTVTGGTINGKTYGVWMNSAEGVNGKLILGTTGGGVNTSSPIILGNRDGITTGGSASIEFYDGVIYGPTTTAYNGAIDNKSNTTTESGYVLATGTETYSGSTYKYTKLGYSITYNLSGGTVSTANPETYPVGNDTITLNNPSKTGYAFAGWVGSNDLSSGLDSYTISSPYNATVRDHFFGNEFDVTPGTTYRVFVTAKRTKGSLSLNGGIYYTVKTSGNAWDGVSGAFTLYEELSDGWGRYYKDVTVPSGKEKGKFYAQIDQNSNTGWSTAWSLADMHVIEKDVAATIPEGSTGNKSYTALWMDAKYGEYNSSGVWQKGYTTLSDAFTGVTNGNTIKPLTDTTEPAVTQAKGTTAAPVTLDLNGHTITTSGTLTNTGVLNINGSGTIATDSTTLSDYRYAIQNNGNLTITNATINSTAANSVYERAIALGSSTAKLTVGSGANIVTTDISIINNYSKKSSISDPAIYITGGTITSKTAQAIWQASASTTGVVYITGGTVKSEGSTAIYNNSTGSINIEGGTVEGNTYGVRNNSTGAITIGTSGGTVSTTSPTIKATGASGIGVNVGSGTFNFYDGVIKAPTVADTINGTVANTESHYGVVYGEDTQAGLKTAYLSENLLEGKTLATYAPGTFSGPTNGVYTGNLTGTYSGWVIDPSNFTANKTYLLRYKIKKTAGSLKSIGGYASTATQQVFTIDGIASSNLYTVQSAASNITDDTNQHLIEFKFLYNGNQTDNNIDIQPNRLYNDSVTVDLYDVELYEVQ